MGIVESLLGLKAKISRATSAIGDEIARLRAAIVEKRHTLKRMKNAAVPLEEIDVRIRDYVDLAGNWWLTHYGSGLIHSERALGDPDLKGAPRLPWTLNEPLPWAAYCAAAPGAAVEILTALVRRVPFEAGPPSSARAGLVAQLEADLAALERAEEEAIDAANAAGIAIEHRADVAQRRTQEAESRRREEESVADRRRRQTALDAAHGPRSRRIILPDASTPSRGGRSAYVTAGRAKLPPVTETGK
jgi:hypothetical protein